MRSLFRLLKNKAFAAVHWKRSNDTSSLDISPFATSHINVEYTSTSKSSKSDSTSHETAQFNALADLAHRVSSDAEYGITSTVDFLAGVKSVQLDDVSDQQVGQIEQTPWPFTSFSAACAPCMNDSADEVFNESGFEFTLPQQVSIEDCDKSVSTLYKWGTLDTAKSEDHEESDFNNATTLHHYDTWGPGQKTPFDRAVTSTVPFALRQDSAQVISTVNIPSHGETLTLEKLQALMKKAGPRAILDLGGTHIVDNGSLLVSISDIIIQNGTLELTQGVILGACRVNLRDLTLISKSSRQATVKVMKKDCCMTQCDVTNVNGVGVQVTGTGATLSMHQTIVHDCERSCICVNRGGILRISDNCVIQGSRSFHGISATDAGTELWIEKTRILNNFQDGVYVTNSAHADLENCEILGSRAFHGIAGKKFGTTVILRNCKLHGFKESALHVSMGAKAKATDTSFRKCMSSHGIVVDGHGSHMDVLNCEVSECNVGGILVRGNGLSKIARTHVFGSAYGNGIVVTEKGSHARIINSVIFQNCRDGVLVMDEGRATLESCDISSSTAGSGVFVRDAGSYALLDSCQLAKNHVANLCADSRASCHTTHCVFDGARNGPSILAKGYGTSVCVTTSDEIVESLQKDVCSICRARITINEKRCRNRTRWLKLKQSNAFSRKLPFSTERR